MLVVGAWIMGQSTLAEFAVALLIGMLTGAYSSILIAVPLLFWLKQTDANWKSKSTVVGGRRGAPRDGDGGWLDHSPRVATAPGRPVRRTGCCRRRRPASSRRRRHRRERGDSVLSAPTASAQEVPPLTPVRRHPTRVVDDLAVCDR